MSVPRASIENTHVEKGPLEHDDAIKEPASSIVSTNYACHKKSEAPIEKNAKEQHVEISKPVSFLRRIYELRKAFQACQSLLTAEEAILTRDIGLDALEILLWFETEKATRSAWSEPPTHKVSYSRLVQRREQMQPQSDSFLRQVCVLREAFRQNSAPSISKIAQIARETGLEDFEVGIWFETESAIQLEYLTTCMPFQQDLWSPQFSHGSVYSHSSLTGTSPVSENVKPNHPNHPEPGLAGNLHLDLAQWETPTLAAQSNKRRRPVNTSSNATSASISSPPDKRLRRTKVQVSYPCLFEGCDSITTDVSKWKEHQLRSHFPRRVWICWLRKDDESDCKHGPVTRADNFATHLVNEHHQSRGSELQRLVQGRGLNVRDLYHEECGFCTEKLKSWEDSMRHIGGHLSGGSSAESWEHRCSTDHDIFSHVEYQPGNQGASDHNEKPDDEDERDDETDEKRKRSADSTFGDQNQDSGDTGHPNDESQESGDRADSGTGAPSTQKHAANNDMLADFQDLSSNTATISIQADEVDTDYVSLEILGHGGFSLVDKIAHRLSRKIYARKTTFYRKSPSRESVEVQFQNEVEILKTLQHPHIIKFIDAYALQDRLSIIMSPVADESLTGLMSRFDQFPPVVQEQNKTSLWRWIGCLASALAYLHDHLIRHQDIKPSNILVRGDQIFLTDFGNAKKFLDDGQAQVRDFRNKLTVTPMYCPPEAMRLGLQGFTADVFSLGCVYAEIITLCLDETLADFELFRSPNPHDGAFRNQLEKTVEWIESLQEDYRQAALQQTAPPAFPLEMICRMLDQDPEQRPTARQIQLKLLPCTCCSTAVTAIETTENVTPLYPSSMEGASGNDEKGNIIPQSKNSRHKIAIVSESEELSFQEAEENYGPRTSSAPKGKMRTVPRPAYVSDSYGVTDTEDMLPRRHRTGKYNNMDRYCKVSRNTPRVTVKNRPEVSKPRMSRQSQMRCRSYYDRVTDPYERRKGEEDRIVTLSDDNSSGCESTVCSESEVSDLGRTLPPPSSAPSSLGYSQAKTARRGDIIPRQHTRFVSSVGEPRAQRPIRVRPRGRFHSPRPEGDTATAEDALARAFAVGYSTGIARYPRGRERRSPTPPLTRERRPPSRPFLHERELPSRQFSRERRPPSPPFTRERIAPSPPFTSASSSVRTGSSIVSPSTEISSPRDSLGSCVSIDEGSFRHRDDSRIEDTGDYIRRTHSRFKSPYVNYDEEYLDIKRHYDSPVGSPSKQLSHCYQRHVN